MSGPNHNFHFSYKLFSHAIYIYVSTTAWAGRV